jgi:hypothetical protein
MTQEPLALTPEAVRAIADQISNRLTAGPQHKSPWLTPDDAGQYLRLTRRGLEDMRGRGTGPKFHKVNDRVVRYHVRDLDSWLLSNGGGDE